MKRYACRLSATAVVLAVAALHPLAPVIRAQDGSGRCAVVTAPDDDPAWGRCADNKIQAQALINEALANNPNLFTASLHAIAPGAKGAKDYIPQGHFTMIAGSFNRIGKKSSDGDVEVATENKTVLYQKTNDLAKFEVMIPQKDASNRVVGALILVFKGFNYGDSEEKLYLQGVAIRDAMAKRLASSADLFKPVK